MVEKVAQFAWPMWTRSVLTQLHKGQIDAAAAWLVCCMPEIGEKFSEVDDRGQRLMFQHEALKGRHQELWRAMKPMVNDGCVEAFEAFLEHYGWELQSTSNDGLTAN
jgi:hypothetical protein